jgi:hypothetical protein
VFSCPSRFPSRMAPLPLPRLGGIGAGLIATLALSLPSIASAQVEASLTVVLPFASAQVEASPAAAVACSESALTQPFAKWGDTNLYELAPQGSFESTPSRWTLKGGAHRVPESEPYGVAGAAGKWSLALPAGAAAQSPYICVSPNRPTFRLFARNLGLLSSLLVQVVYKTPYGPVAIPVGVVANSGSWQPTQPMSTEPLKGSELSGGSARAALRFTATTGESRIDDVFIDPRMR